jgi:hypothetical protein
VIDESLPETADNRDPDIMRSRAVDFAEPFSEIRISVGGVMDDLTELFSEIRISVDGAMDDFTELFSEIRYHRTGKKTVFQCAQNVLD